MAANMADRQAAMPPGRAPRRRTGTNEGPGGAARVTQATAPPDGADPKGRAPAEDERESFGAWLQREREMREISLREIADTSKISLRYLQALEDDRFDLLPAPVFAKGFLRQYARYVGLDPEETVNFFLAASRSEAEETDSRPVPAPTKPFPFVLAALAVALVLIAAAWALTRLNRAPAEETEALSRSAPAAEEPPAAVPLVEEPTETPAPAPVPPEGASPEEVPLIVTLDFRGDCWIEATVDGELKEPGQLGVQGESLRFEAQERVHLKVGNVTMVDLEVNGTPYTIAPGSPLRELEIDLATAESLARNH